MLLPENTSLAQTIQFLSDMATDEDQYDNVRLAMHEAIRANPANKAALLDSLELHENLVLRHASWSVREKTFSEDELITDIVVARRKTPLKPGTKIQLYGGYASAHEDNENTWLGPGSFWNAKVIDLVFLAPIKPPLLWAELDERKHVGEISGQYVLLKLRYFANWHAKETVSVCLLDSLPINLAKFYGEHPYFPKEEIETHASYQLADKELNEC